jgi:hypothetical protein
MGAPRFPARARLAPPHERWRRSDPWLHPEVRRALVRELMAARRVQDRPRTHLAKQALGERGPAWHTVAGRRERSALLPRLLADLGLPLEPEDAAQGRAGP